MTAALEGGEGSSSRLGRSLPPGKNWYPFYRRLGGPQCRSGRTENLVPTRIRSRIVQTAVSRNTDWATHFPINILHNTQYDIIWSVRSRFLMVANHFFFRDMTVPSGSGTPHCRGFTITLRHTALDKNPRDQWSARRRDLYMTTHNTYKKQT